MSKPKKSTKKINQDTGIKLVYSFLLIFISSSMIVYLANTLFPQNFVLGTGTITPFWALIHAIGSLALIDTLAIPIIHEIENYKGRMLTSSEWMFKYFVINLAAVYLLTRFAEQLGFGISSWIYVVAIAIVLDFVQGMVMMVLEKQLPSK